MARTRPHTEAHKDGSIRARGQMLDGLTHGYWEWFRKDGVIMRSGHFCRGEQCGEWTTYDKAGNVYKVTRMKGDPPRAPPKPAATNPARAPAKSPPAKTRAEPSAAEFMATLDHPLRAEITGVRKAILSVDTSIADGVKWNSLSFRTTEWFATVNLRSHDSLQLVLHLGARTGRQADPVPDPKGLLKWLGKDRALASLGAGPDLRSNLPALKALVRAWIASV